MKTILVPTDFSKNSETALKYAIQFAKEKKCKLIFYHSYYNASSARSKKANAAMELGSDMNKVNADLIKWVKAIYRELKMTFSTKSIEVIVEFGKDVVKSINGICNRSDVSMIIMGTHGKTGLKSILFGSNTVKVIDTANCPVLAIPIGKRYQSANKLIYTTDLFNTKKELSSLTKLNEILKMEIKTVYFDNGIEKTKEELTNLAVLERSGLTVQNVKVDIGFHLVTELSKQMKGKKDALLCLFHYHRSRIMKYLIGSNSDELALQLKMPLLILKK